MATISVAVPVTPPAVAVICAVPWFRAVVSPCVSTVATEVASELQVKPTPVILFPLESLAVALNCCVSPGAMVAHGGTTVTLTTVGGGVTMCAEPPEPPQPESPRTNPMATNCARAVAPEWIAIKRLSTFLDSLGREVLRWTPHECRHWFNP